MTDLPSNLYRFFSLPERDIPTLKEGLVYYPEPSQLNDPFDCQISVNTDCTNIAEEHRLIYAQFMMRSVMEETGESIRFSTDEDWPFQDRFNFLCEDFLTCMFRYGIHSLTEDCYSPLMWSHYASAFNGFVVTYDTKKPIAENVAGTTFKVKYQNEIPNFDIITLLKSNENWDRIKMDLLTIKGDAWSYENEWRVIIWPGGRKERIPFAVSEVIFGHMLSDDSRLQLRELFGSKVKYKVAIPSEEKFEVEIHNADEGRRRISNLARPQRKRFTYFYNKKRS